MSKNYWLMKSEPEVYSIDQMKKEGKTLWTGVRNYQARNFMRPTADHSESGESKKTTHGTSRPPRMKVGDLAFFYHSNANPPGIAGLIEITKLGVPDPTQFDPHSEYYEPKASKEKPIWFCAEVKFKKKFKKFLSLDEIRRTKGCQNMLILQKGSRLSITPVSKREAEALLKLIDKARK